MALIPLSFLAVSGVAALSPLTVDYLTIAGGGGGGSSNTVGLGGGGAGGYRTSAGPSGGGASAESQFLLAVATNYAVTVGAGGAIDNNGSNSVFNSITSTGGGRGGDNDAPATGGSGGGSGLGTATGAAGTTGQGFAGGNMFTRGGYVAAGAGGGAGGVGGNGNTNNQPGNGGAGLSLNITGTSVGRAGGGGGGLYNEGNQGVGGTASDGGGAGGRIYGNGAASVNATAGTANTGGGGGGAGGSAAGQNSSSAAGGSGVVIIRYPSQYVLTGGSGLTSTTATVGGNSVTTFTAGTGTIQFAVPEPVAVNYLVIAGGGGGGGVGGGGGAGGYRTSAGTSGGGAAAEAILSLFTASNYTVTVGAGGGGSTGGDGSAGTQGANSVFGTITSTGGGFGRGGVSAAGTGGSGGGGRGGAGGSGTANQGFAGGGGNNGSGGGGAGQAGQTRVDGNGGNGGNGVASSITGSSVTRAGGGGAGGIGGVPQNQPGTGGSGGGGNGTISVGIAGTANTGGGGGGGGFSSNTGFNGAAGGSGVVIISYPSTFQITGGAGLTFSTAAVGANHVTTFTAGTGTIQLVPAQQAFVLLESTVLTSQQSAVEFTNLTSKYADNYQHLQIRAVVRTDRGGLNRDTFQMRANGDSSSNYSIHAIYGDGSSVVTNGGVNETSIWLGAYVPGSTAPSGQYSSHVLDLLDPFDTTKFKTVRTFSGGIVQTAENGVNLASSCWRSTSAISSLRLYSIGNLVAGTRVSLYGIRGS